MKILCACQGGNKRSVSLAYLLKDKYKHDALSVGLERNSKETVDMLSFWADKIIVVQPWLKEFFPKHRQDKISVFDVGPDRWDSPFHPDLVQQMEIFIQAEGLNE